MSVGDCSQQSHSHRGFAQDGLTRYNLCFLEEAPLISVADSTHTDVWSSATHTSLYSYFFFLHGELHLQPTIGHNFFSF